MRVLLVALVVAAGCTDDPLAAFVTGNDFADLPRVEVSVGASLVITAVVAETAQTRTRGLKGVESVPDGAGMLFLFPEPAGPAGRGGFWMLDTIVPLDIAFAADGIVVGVATMTPCPGPPCPITHPGVDYDAALEVGAGVLGAAGVAPGDRIDWRRVDG